MLGVRREGIMELDNLKDITCEICGKYFEESSRVEGEDVCDECVEEGIKTGRFVENPDL